MSVKLRITRHPTFWIRYYRARKKIRVLRKRITRFIVRRFQ